MNYVLIIRQNKVVAGITVVDGNLMKKNEIRIIYKYNKIIYFQNSHK